MTRVRAAWAAVLAAGLAAGGRADDPPKKADPAAKPADPPLKAAVADAIRKGLKAEDDPLTKLLFARSLLKVAPDDADAAKALVSVMTDPTDRLGRDAHRFVFDLMPSGPPALVKAVLALLKDSDPGRRRMALELLDRIEPKAMP